MKQKVTYMKLFTGFALATMLATTIGNFSPDNILPPESTPEVTLPEVTVPQEAPDYIHGVWLTTVFNLDFPSSRTLTEGALRSEMITIADNLAEREITHLYFQVRPQSDAFYASDIFPPSFYLTGDQTVEPPFDVLEYLIELCHERGIELHAWINPYRVTRSETDVLAPDHIALQHPELVVECEGSLYFDPALPEVQEIILDGISEILVNYEVDGIHFDDYFYPSNTFDDASSYEKYGNGMSLDAFRRNNVTNLVSAVYDLVHETSDTAIFGISPAGIWANASSMEGGSQTNGGQTYFLHYADTRQWVYDGIIDYIAPQIYWQIGFEIAEYITLVDWWCDVAEGTGVDLYIGQASYRQSSGAFTEGEIDRQIAYNKTKEQVGGSIYFRYEHIL
ncbi:MAG: family 10 glycosylhydrolase [Eubacteriales bacterium]